MSKRPTPDAVLHQVGRRWNATVHEGNWEFESWLEFKVDGVPASLMIHVETRNSPSWSLIQLQWPS